MANLIGHAHQAGSIVFERRDNPWAFRRLDDELKSGQENRIKFDPSIAPVLIEPSPNTKAESIPWLSDIQSILQSASFVYLQRTDDSLRFRQSVFHLGEGQSLITLGSAAELQHFAAEHWTKLSHIYALRYNGFRFDIEKAVAHDRDRSHTFERIEIQNRLVVNPNDGVTHFTFDATGSTAHVDLITWRASVADGEVGRFAPSNRRISLLATNFTQPFSFCSEYHAEFKSHWYLFSPKMVNSWIKKMNRKKS